MNPTYRTLIIARATGPDGKVVDDPVLRQLAEYVKSRDTVFVKDAEGTTHVCTTKDVEVTEKGVEATVTFLRPLEASETIEKATNSRKFISMGARVEPPVCSICQSNEVEDIERD